TGIECLKQRATEKWVIIGDQNLVGCPHALLPARLSDCIEVSHHVRVTSLTPVAPTVNQAAGPAGWRHCLSCHAGRIIPAFRRTRELDETPYPSGRCPDAADRPDLGHHLRGPESGHGAYRPLPLYRAALCPRLSGDTAGGTAGPPERRRAGAPPFQPPDAAGQH